VDYGATSITKTTPSLLSGDVSETEARDATTLLLTGTTRTGKSHDIDGNLVTVSKVTTHSYDSIGRIIEENGPLDDSVALDKTTTAYYTTYDASWPNNFGRVQSVTSFALTPVPLFILMGEVLFHTGLAVKVIDGV